MHELRACQVGVGEGSLSEVDEGVAETIGKELRACQVGVGEVGLSEVGRRRTSSCSTLLHVRSSVPRHACEEAEEPDAWPDEQKV